MAEADSNGDATFKVTLDGDGVHIAKELDQGTALQVVELVMGGGSSATPTRGSHRSSTRPKRTGAAKSSGDEQTKTTRRRRSSSPGIVKELSLRPSGKQAFVDFAGEKEPSSHAEKQAVAVYWLQHVAEIDDGITVGHVNTCYQEAGWTRPKDLTVSMRLTASKTGWLDTSDAQNITTTTRGEDFVRHSLPAPPKG